MLIPSRAVSVPKPISITKNTLFNTIGCLVYQGCMWLITVLVVYISGYADSGVLAYAMAVGNVFLSIASFNIRVFQVSDIENAYTPGNYAAFRILTVILAYALMLPYIYFTTENAALVFPTILFLLFKTDEAFADVLYAIDQKAERMDFIGISQGLRGIAVASAFTASLHFFGSIEIAFIAMFCTGFSFTVAYDLPHALRFGSLDIKIQLKSVKSLFVDGFPIVVSLTLYSAITTVARQTFGNIYGAEELGFYAAVATPAVLVQAAARYLYAPSLVPFAEMVAKSDYLESRSFFFRTIAVIVAAALATMVALGFVGPKMLLVLYGPSIEPYADLIVAVALCTFMLSLSNYLLDVLTILRDMRYGLLVTFFAFLGCVVLSEPLIRLFGMDGLNSVIVISTLLIMVAAFTRIVFKLARA